MSGVGASPPVGVGWLSPTLSSILTETVGVALDTAFLSRLLFGVTAVLAVGVLVVLSRPTETWYAAARQRLLFGVPWGTLAVIAGLLGIYYGIQGGLDDPANPIVLPFRAWSYFDPIGILSAGFTHSSFGHLTGNLLATLVFGSFAEFVWSHHVDRRTNDLPGRLWTHPVVRALVIFPAVVVAVGLIGTLVALGPIIGFSTVVFAFAGFTLVRYPLATVVASVASGGASTLFTALRVPEQVAVAETTFSTPWFASIAVQGHAVGLFLGILLGLALLRHRDDPAPSAARIWLGVLLFALSRSLWAVYWFRGNNVYVLYRAGGVALVFVLVAIVTYAVVARDKPLVPRRAVANPETFRAAIASMTSREFGLLVLICGASIIVGPAIAVNFTTAGEEPLPGDPIEIRGYEVTYGEDVPDGQLSAIDIEVAGETTQLNTSGVIVRNTDRHIWTTPITRAELADSGEEQLHLGGLGWRETVTVSREGWAAVGGDTAYRVTLSHDDENRTAFQSPPAESESLLAGNRISIAPADAGFTVEADDGDRVVSEPVPAVNESVRLGEIEIVNDGSRLVATYDETAVRVATRE